MQALNLNTKDLSIEQILNDPLNYRVIEALGQFSEILKKFDYTVSACSYSGLKKLPEVSDGKKEQIIKYYQDWCQWIESAELPAFEDLDIEKICLKRVLDNFGFVVHEDFWKTLEKGHIIEIYGKDMVQLYRSLSFYKVTGYSLLDLSIHEWYVLWNRPKRCLEEAMVLAKEVLDTYTPVKRYKIPRHIIQETYDTGITEPFVPRAILAEFMNVGSLSGYLEGTPQGLICTSKAQVIAFGDEAKNIQFV